MRNDSEKPSQLVNFTNFEDTLAEALGENPSDATANSVAIAKLRLFFFIKIATQSGWLTGLDYRHKKRVSKTLEEITDAMLKYGAEGFTEKRLVAFQNASNHGDLTISDSFIQKLILAVQETSEYKNHSQLRQLWRNIFGAESGYMPHLLQRLIRTESNINNTRIEEHNTELLHDYLLFRPDPYGLISTALFRFYVHETNCIRSLGLRLDQAHQYLSSKGWLIKQDKGAIATGYIVDRSSNSGGVLMNGGVSTLFIDTSASNPLSRPDEKTGKLMIASCFHFQAAFENEPSAARAILVRLKGVETAGGQYAQSKRKRNKKTRDLQNLLSKRFGQPVLPSDCCQYLSNISGLSKTHFEDIFAPDLTDRDLVVEDMVPYMPWKPGDKHSEDRPQKDIFIDGTKSLNEQEGFPSE